jgi:hypothetical protein
MVKGKRQRLEKTREIRVRCTPLDAARIAALARLYELSGSGTIRRLLAQACEREGLQVRS